jgi:two-component sensor histidine kinase
MAEAIGASKIARDITERRRAQKQQRLLLQEMGQRIKNLLAVASGIVSLSTRDAKSASELAAIVSGRLGALSRAHALILADPEQHNHETTLRALIKAILAPFETGPPGMRASNCKVEMSACPKDQSCASPTRAGDHCRQVRGAFGRKR